MENFLVVQSVSMGEASICVPCFSVLTVQKFQKLQLFNISLDIQTFSSQPVQVRNHPSKIQRKTKQLQRSTKLKTVDFVRCIRILIVRLFQKKPLVQNFSQLSNSSLFVTHNQRLRCFYQRPNQKFLPVKTFSTAIFSFYLFALE